jgi:hypothetical protein
MYSTSDDLLRRVKAQLSIISSPYCGRSKRCGLTITGNLSLISDATQAFILTFLVGGSALVVISGRRRIGPRSFTGLKTRLIGTESPGGICSFTKGARVQAQPGRIFITRNVSVPVEWSQKVCSTVVPAVTYPKSKIESGSDNCGPSSPRAVQDNKKITIIVRFIIIISYYNKKLLSEIYLKNVRLSSRTDYCQWRR